MLELNRKTDSWSWGATGKHPCARDYLTIGNNGPLFSSLASWVNDGYSLHAKNVGGRTFCSWRFWLQAGLGNELAVGLIRESCDAIGRPFPLLIMGTGCFPGWQQRWNLLSQDCEATWIQVEQLAATSLPDLPAFAEMLRTIRPPAQKIADRLPSPPENDGIELASGESAGILKINDNNPAEHLAELCLALMRANPSPLKGLFVGGSLEKLSLLWFRRPLIPGDFELLWPGNSAN